MSTSKVQPSAGKPLPPNAGKGRPKGVPNKATADIKAAAAIHGPKALAVLMEIASSTKAPTASRVAAAVALLDRGFGKPTQTVDGNLRFSVAAALAALDDA